MVKNKSSSLQISKLKTNTFAVLAAVACAVILPQLVHMAGREAGVGSGIGEMLLPMHLPVLFLGLLTGPAAGAIAGALSPIVSFALTGMPTEVMLPYLMIELTVYGLVAGFMSRRSSHTLINVFTAQILGRVARSFAVAASIYLFESQALAPSATWTYITAGLSGMAVQLLVLPVFVKFVDDFRAKRGA